MLCGRHRGQAPGGYAETDGADPGGSYHAGYGQAHELACSERADEDHCAGPVHSWDQNPRDELAAIREAKNCDALTAMKEMINPDSLNVLPCCYIEKYAAGMKPLSYLQFQRIGYFNVDRDSTTEKMVFNRTVGLKDTWGKINK